MPGAAVLEELLPVVRRHDHERPVGQPVALERIEHAAHVLVGPEDLAVVARDHVLEIARRHVRRDPRVRRVAGRVEVARVVRVEGPPVALGWIVVRVGIEHVYEEEEWLPLQLLERLLHQLREIRAAARAVKGLVEGELTVEPVRIARRVAQLERLLVVDRFPQEPVGFESAVEAEDPVQVGAAPRSCSGATRSWPSACISFPR